MRRLPPGIRPTGAGCDKRKIPNEPITKSNTNMKTADQIEPTPGEADKNTIRPLCVNIPEAELTELRTRINATKWPEKETVADQSQGVQLATIQALARYWGTDYDFGRVEGRLNALPQFVTRIDGLDIHFIHVESRHESALPLVITHGWPGSVIEMLNVVGPLTDPPAH